MSGSRHKSETRRAKITLAQFSRNLASLEPARPPAAALDAAPADELANIREKHFAAEVVAAMSKPAARAPEAAPELPKVGTVKT